MLRFALLWTLKWELLDVLLDVNWTVLCLPAACEDSCWWHWCPCTVLLLAVWFCPAARTVRWEMPAPGEGLVPHSWQHSWSPQQSVLAANGREVEGNDTLSWGWGCPFYLKVPNKCVFVLSSASGICLFIAVLFVSSEFWGIFFFAVFSCIVTSFVSLTGWNQMERDYVWLFESPLSCNFFYVAKL